MTSHAAPPRPPKGSITEDGRYSLDLTGPHSHTLVTKPGVGSLVIGPAAMGKKADLHVESDERIDWSVFDPFATGAGSPWPRWLYYIGGDTGFFAWARERRIEVMMWSPVLPTDTAIDASESRIGDLQIQLDQPGGRLHLTLPKTPTSSRNELCVSGDLARFSADGDIPFLLTLIPRTSARRNAVPYLLPDMGVLHQVTHLELNCEPMRQPISLRCLQRFPNLKKLALRGSFSDLDVLANQSALTKLQLRFMPDLDALPPLGALPHLDSFLAFNVEEAAGKHLRQQVKARATVRPWEFVSITQLRKPEWWAKEYGRPFSAWPARLAKQANQAYDAALSALAQAQSLSDAEAALTTFAARFNTLKGIETPERDDLGEAVCQLSQTSDAARLHVTEEMAQRWFDAVRDY